MAFQEFPAKTNLIPIFYPALDKYKGYKEEFLLNPSIFAAEFVKDNYDQYGSIKLKGYDLPIDIDQYDF